MPSSIQFDSRSAHAAMQRDWQMLCAKIGERRAGTAAERRAVDYIAAKFAGAGLPHVRVEAFPCTSVRRAVAQVHERNGSRWRRVVAAPLVGAPGTPNGKTVEGDLVWLELPEQSMELRPDSLRGRILAWFGPLPTDVAVHRRLLAAKPAAVIHIDERLPFSWVKNDGVYPFWTRAYGMPTTLTVPYADAWRWRREGVKRLRVRVTVDQVETQSHNVVAELPGRSPDLPAIALTAHHDTQCGNPGADDNASGVVCLLALARALGGRRPRRSIRFLSFGTEEQLSVGSAAYVRAHEITSSDVGLVINFDSVSSPLGHFVMSVAGHDELSLHAKRAVLAGGLAVQVQPEITPFADMFPFNRVGVPSLYFLRSNFSGGRWQHHSQHDTLENISTEPVARLLTAVAPLVVRLGEQRSWPFPSGLPAAQRRLAHQLGCDLLGE